MVDVLGQLGRGLGLSEQIQQRPQKRALAQLGLQEAQLGLEQKRQALGQQQIEAGQQQTQFDQSQAVKRAQIINQSAKALKQIDPTQRSSAFKRLSPRLEQFGIDPAQLQGAEFTDELLDNAIASTDGIIRDPSKLTAAQTERQQLLKAIEPAMNEQGQLDKSKLTPESKSAAIALRLLPPEATTKEERLADDPEATERVAKSQARIKGAVEEEKKVAAARGENFNELRAAEAAMPGIEEVVGQLRLLVDDATFTLGGKAFNRVAKEFGYSATGDTARASMVAMVDNQVLPLLRPIFGAAFTKAEGDSLKAALINPDSTPDSRRAQLDAFLTQMQRNIETKKNQQQATTGQAPVKRLRFDARGDLVQ